LFSFSFDSSTGGPSRAWRLASPPEIESVGGEFAGAKAEVRLVAQGRQLTSIEKRVLDVEEGHAALVDAVKQMREEVKRESRKG
jgi:hypothetical protein